VACKRYYLKNEDSLLQQEWHVKETSLLKAISSKDKIEFAALSPLMGTAAR
jgi:hypothetical protein